jgi:23S rRNA pseudouridine1911/1915/1917 synthase
VRIVSHPTPLGREARLAYRVRGTAGGRSLVEIELETGRKHQIRLQLAHVGCPIVGDVRYGASEPLPSRQIALLAREICVEHPTRRETLTFTAPAPAGWPWPTSEPPGEAPFWNWSDYAPALRGHVW